MRAATPYRERFCARDSNGFSRISNVRSRASAALRLMSCRSDPMMTIVESIRAEYVRYKTLAEAAIRQLDDAQLAAHTSDNSNSIATMCWHVAGNLKSRFTDFLTSDGEKPWRHREEEFQPRTVTKAELFDKWADGWAALLEALGGLRDDQLHGTVTIRQQTLA